MKAKRSKAHKRTSVRKKSKSTTRKKTRHLQKRSIPPQSQTPPPVNVPDFKTCEEPEVGDIGGFGDVDAFESHEKLCGEKATEFCGTCGKNLCSNHYELMHREHNSAGHQPTTHSMAQ